MNYSTEKILDFIGNESYPALFSLCSENLVKKLNFLNITTMKEIQQYSFEFYYSNLTCDEFSELLYHLIQESY